MCYYGIVRCWGRDNPLERPQTVWSFLYCLERGSSLQEQVIDSMSKNLNVKMMPTGDVVPYEKNPRLNDQAVDAVASSIREFGFKVPIVVDGKGVVVSGHTRLKAAKALGLDEVPVIVADDLDDTKIKAFRLADNKVAELADWDESLLIKELEELDDLNYDMGQFDFELDLDDADDADGDGSDDAGDIPDNIDVVDTFALNVIVKNEAEQAELYDELLGRGYDVKVVAL